MASAQTVVVGVDGSEHSFRAASWAATEAGRRRAPLHVVIVNDDPARSDYVAKAVREAAERCRTQSPELEVTDEVVTGRPIEELVRRSHGAQMIVLGSRGNGGFTDAMLGSVSTAVATHGACPVVVVRGDISTAGGPVVVGLDDSPGGHAALGFAFGAAAARRSELLALQAWHEEGLLAVPLPPADREEIQGQIERSLVEQVAGWSDTYPDIAVRTVAQHGHPVAALADAARGAQLLVVGHRGRGGFSGLFLGSVASGVLHHSPCPVVVIRAPQ